MPSSPWNRTAIPCFNFAQFALDTTSQLLLKIESKYKYQLIFSSYYLSKTQWFHLEHNTSVNQKYVILIDGPVHHVWIWLPGVQMFIEPFTAIFKWLQNKVQTILYTCIPLNNSSSIQMVMHNAQLIFEMCRVTLICYTVFWEEERTRDVLECLLKLDLQKD